MKVNSSILRYVALSMALLMFSTSAGVAMNLHYCGGEFQDFSLFKKAKSCHEKATHKKSCHHAVEKIDIEENQDCCDNETFFFQLDEDYTSPSKIDLQEKKQSKAGLSFDKVSGIAIDSYQAQFYKNYKPPLLAIDPIIDFQSFLL